MAASTPVSEEDLHAFVDGETDAQTNAVILAHLALSPADAARVNMWRAQNELIRDNFSDIEREPIPLSLSLTPARSLRSDALRYVPEERNTHIGEDLTPPAIKAGDLAKLCAAIGVAFAAGMMAALVTPSVTRPLTQLFPSQPPAQSSPAATELPLPASTLRIARLRENAAMPDGGTMKSLTETPISQNGPNPAPLLFRDLAALEIIVIGFQVGAAASDPALCLFLMAKPGTPLTLCVEKAGALTSPGFRTLEEPPLRSVDWLEKSGRFALAGRMPESALLDLAHNLHTRMSAVNR